MSTSKKTPGSPELVTGTDTVIAEIVDTGVSLTDPMLAEPATEAAEHRLADPPAPESTGAGPRTRWAAIVWGLVFAALASGTLYVVLSPQHRLELIEWVTSLEPTTLALYGALAIGVIVLLFGLVGLLRRAQRALAARRSSER